MSGQRFYVGNLNSTVTDSDLRELFEKFGQVVKSEIIVKEDKIFAFVNVCLSAASVPSLIKRLTGSRWKGKEISVQVAKESYLDRLARERQVQQGSDEKPSKRGATANKLTPSYHRNEGKEEIKKPVETKPSTNFSKPKPEVTQPSLSTKPSPVVLNITPEVTRSSATSHQKIAPKPACEEHEAVVRSPEKKVAIPASTTRESGSRSHRDSEQIALPSGSEPIVKSTKRNFEEVVEKPFIMKLVRKPSEKRGEKHKLDNQKRLKTVFEIHEKTSEQQKLVSAALKSQNILNKKIKFDDVQDSEKSQNDRKKALFEDEVDEDMDEVVLKQGMEIGGKKQEKLIQLQSKFASDPRFQIDEKFVEDEGSSNSDKDEDEEAEADDEVGRNLNVLEEVLGKPLLKKPKPSEEGAAKKPFIIPRFDPTKPDSEKFELKKPAAEAIPVEKAAAESKTEAPPVTADRYYEYDKSLKELFTKDDQETPTATFSLSKLLGGRSTDDADEEEEEEDSEEVEKTVARKDSSKSKEATKRKPDCSTEKPAGSTSKTSDANLDAGGGKKRKASSGNGGVHHGEKFFLDERMDDLAQDIFFRADAAEKAVKQWKERNKILVEVFGRRRRYATKKLKEQKQELKLRQKTERIKKFKGGKAKGSQVPRPAKFSSRP